MKLIAIRRLNVVTSSLVVVGVLTILGGLAVSLVLDSEPPFAITNPTGWACFLAGVLLSFAVDRVKCFQCGKPFNRPDYKNWFVRNFARTQPHWSCVHCGRGGEDASAGPSR